jgi:hypothetical protein
MLALQWALRNLSVDADRCVLSGHSMGAVATWNVAARFAHSWAGIAPVNGALSLWERIGPDGAAAAMLPNLLDMPVLALHGSDDQRIPAELEAATIEVLQTLGNANAAQILVEGGDHPLPTMNLTPGAPHFETMVSWILAQRRQPYPRSISHRALDLDHGRCHWVEILEFDDVGGSAAIHAALTPPREESWPAPGLSIPRGDGSGGARPRECQEIVVRTSGVRRLALHLHHHFVEPGDVRIVVNGRSSQHQFTPEAGCLLESHRTSGDTGLLSEQVLTVDVSGHDDDDQKGSSEWKWTVDSIF